MTIPYYMEIMWVDRPWHLSRNHKKTHHETSHPVNRLQGSPPPKNSPISNHPFVFFWGGKFQLSTLPKSNQMSGKTIPQPPLEENNHHQRTAPRRTLGSLSFPINSKEAWVLKAGHEGLSSTGPEKMNERVAAWKPYALFFFWGVVGVAWLDDFCVFFLFRDNITKHQKNVTWFQPEPWDFETKHPEKNFWAGKRPAKDASFFSWGVGIGQTPTTMKREMQKPSLSQLDSHEALDKKWRFAMKLTWKLMAKFGQPTKMANFASFWPNCLGFFSFSVKIVSLDVPTCRFLALTIPATWLGGCQLYYASLSYGFRCSDYSGVIKLPIWGESNNANV